MNPKHCNPTRSERVAHAPYNFVPLPEKVVPVNYDIPGHDRYVKGTHTGYIDCYLKTLTPIYTRTALEPEFFAQWADDIREMMKDEQARRKYGQFFRLDDANRPVIPASSLRGMVRSLIEIAGYGKMQWVTEKQLFFRTMDNSSVGKHYLKRMGGNIESGFLRKCGDNYYIVKCEMVRIGRSMLGDESNIYEGNKPNQTPKWSGRPAQYIPVWVSVSQDKRVVERLEYEPKKGLQEGRLVITGNIKNKKKEFVFLLPEQNAEKISVPYELIERFHDEDQITQWQEKAFPKNRPQKDCRRRNGELRKDLFLQEEGEPIFFLRENDKLTFFGRAQMFRLPYERSPFDFVPVHLRQHHDKMIDLAEAIFGYVANDRHASGRGGRVYFTDAVCLRNQTDVWYSEEPKTPHILSSPKPTAFQHYLVQDKNKEHDPDNKNQLAHYGTMTPQKTVIRGHKLYWHKQSSSWIEDVNNWDNDTQHTQMRPVKTGVEFYFRIYFENLTDVELGALLWVLDLPEGHHHKIGMGKPLGLGSVAITPKLVTTDRVSRYQKLFYDNTWHTAESRENDLDRYKREFERYVLEYMDTEERGDAQKLKDVHRIQILLRMLQFPGPVGNTEYMTRDEFKNRPVLPDPLNINQNVTVSHLNTGQNPKKNKYKKRKR